jgi:secondary thiamine-phosphate synthase enzyme
MKVYSENFSIETRGEYDFKDLTASIDGIVKRSGIKEGIALVFAGHATGVIAITEYESGLLGDIRELMARITPTQGPYHHPYNAAAHLRSLLLAPSRVVPVSGGRLVLGTWQSVFWMEAETRPRRRTVQVFVLGEE